MIFEEKTKPVPIIRGMVKAAYRNVKVNPGSFVVDGISLSDYQQDLQKNLYKIWSRLSSGSYFLPRVKEVEIPKGNGKLIKLGISTVTDRVAQ